MKNVSSILTLLFMFTNSIINAQQKDSITDYDGNVYQTVVIGDQEWMAENLKVKHNSNGTEIPLVQSSSEWDDLGWTEKAYCMYDSSTSSIDTYGGLYTWTAAMDSAVSSDLNPSGVQGVCPDGWHLPSNAEWLELSQYLSSNAGGKLKEAGTSHWNSPNTGATNESGFTALPGGIRYQDGNFGAIGDMGTWWTSSENNAAAAWRRTLQFVAGSVGTGQIHKAAGLSVRCVKNTSTFINRNDMRRSITLYPNPTNGVFQIEFSNHTKASVLIYSMTGEFIHSEQIIQTNTTINLSHLQKGIYLIKIQSDDYIKIEKLVIER